MSEPTKSNGGRNPISIGPNYFYLTISWGGLIGILVVLALINRTSIPALLGHNPWLISIFVFGVLATVFRFCAIIFWSPCRVDLWDEKRCIRCEYLFGREMLFLLDDVTNFSDGWLLKVNYRSRILYLKSGKKYELSEFTLRSIDELNAFLERNGVAFRGEEKSWFPWFNFGRRYPR